MIEIINKSGLSTPTAMMTCQYYLAHFEAALKKYESLNGIRTEQKKYVMERLLFVKKGRKVTGFATL